MKSFNLLIFLVIVLSVYSSVNIYIYLKGYNSIPGFHQNRIWYFIGFLLLSSAFVAGKILESRHSSLLSDVLNIIGGFWLAFMLYGFLFLILSDIISIPLKLSGIIGSGNLALYKKWSFIITIVLSAGLITGGFINALIPVIRKYDISIEKSAGEIRELKIAAVSDLHMGSIIRRRSLKELSGILRELKPDVIFLLGDIVDGEIGPVLRDDLLSYLTFPVSNDKVIAITGNHEFIGGAAKTIPYIEGKGLRLLKDEVAVLEGGIQVIGRIDRDGKNFYSMERKALNELMLQADTSRPIILLDHQPFKLDESVKYGIDLQLSGHTHNGQMWPLNYVTDCIYELAHGYLKKGNTHFIVSSGFGIWGPRVRLGSRPEVLSITLKFKN